jgi:hypothetical protein
MTSRAAGKVGWKNKGRVTGTLPSPTPNPLVHPRDSPVPSP